MAQLALDDYPDRYALVNELHARPFPELKAPCRALHLAIKQPGECRRPRPGPRAGAPHRTPRPLRRGAPRTGRQPLLGPARPRLPEMGDAHRVRHLHAVRRRRREGALLGRHLCPLPADWLAEAPGAILTSCLLRIESLEPEAFEQRIATAFPEWFVTESLAVSRVVDGEAVIAGDFRIDEHGHERFVVLAMPGIGRRRLGRIAQRVLEIETYKCAAMLALPLARQVSGAVARLDGELTEVVARMAAETGHEPETLDRLLKMAAEIEHLSSTTAFRFGAAGAYEAIVNQRIQVLREERIGGRQLFGEFMTRRFDPAMRTCRSAKERLGELSDRAERAANLLRTRVDVANQQQNVEVLRGMDRRAAMQLRLQETVEGLSVVAISYYAVSLAEHIFAPARPAAGLADAALLALLTVPVVLIVWLLVRRIRSRVARPPGGAPEA